MSHLELEQIVQNPDFIRMADSYIPYITKEGPVSYKTVLADKLRNITQSEFLVPVLGIQGTGKSSLLNALLMEDLVLPVDADETTCIPVEIRYSTELDGQVHVIFENGRKTEVFTDKSRLEQYVHNQHNLGNEKLVSHIVIYKNDDLLKNNVVLVDLPGVGSMTARNVETTMKYIDRLNAAMFLLRTVPPITKPERIFLTHAWPKLTTAWFIQNQWNDESKQEVQEGMELNLKILSDIAAQYQTSAPKNVHVINVYQGLNGRLQKDWNAYEKSGMKQFRSLLEEIAGSWRTLLSSGLVMHLKELSAGIRHQIDARKRELSMTSEELKKLFQEQEARFEQMYRSNSMKISQIQGKLSDYKIGLMDYAAEASKVHSENLRSEMRRIIGSGVVDGELLDSAYRDTRDSIMIDALEELSLKLFEMQKEMTIWMDSLEIRDLNGEYDKSGNFNKEEALKFEKALPYGFGIAGGIGGIAAGGWVGTKVGALVGTSLGPAGTIIGGAAGFVVGAGIAFVSSWLGGKAKGLINEERQKATMRDIEEPIRQFRQMLNAKIEDSANGSIQYLTQALSAFKQTQFEQLQNEKAEHEEVMRLRRQGRDEAVNLLAKDEALIKSIEGRLA
ncbi:dynamin family protein [Paenibacillus odorifer]|uniref:dynamin family protein n=1 Tax=Paenibacillus TaxID=44249 RepID=UPI00096FF2C7|nr:dynamin family protein [Paenibacillus odorifer]OME26368.1 hypothetical protein BSK57_08730 [Paenibacillus odorifer]OME35782.1 hypothetical protein BSK63_05515 [Paenibacillus odorifer]OME40700.1 hypothetical protein BSK46_06700 [Paenibacillus odorifer]